MDNILFNLLSGLFGALVGAFAGIYAVHHSHVLQAKAALRNLLVAQRVAIRMLGTTETQKQQKEDFLKIYQAYQNLLCIAGPKRRRALEKAWHNYKGNIDETLPLFGNQKKDNCGNSTSVTTTEFSRDEVMNKIESFLKCLS